MHRKEIHITPLCTETTKWPTESTWLAAGHSPGLDLFHCFVALTMVLANKGTLSI